MKNKTMIFLLVFSLISVIVFTTINAQQETQNEKSYDPQSRTIIIYNGLDVIAEIQLISEPVVYVMPGEDRKVAEFKVMNYIDDYPNFIENIEFFDLKTQVESECHDYEKHECIHTGQPVSRETHRDGSNRLADETNNE